VIKENRLYLTTAVGSEEKSELSLRALCLDASTGRTVWDSEVFGHDLSNVPRGHAKNSQASPTPCWLRTGYTFTSATSAPPAALDGAVLWRSDAVSYPPVHGNGGSPVLVENALIFNADGGSKPFVAALDKRTASCSGRQTATPASGKPSPSAHH
jgi:hypothetical protein